MGLMIHIVCRVSQYPSPLQKNPEPTQSSGLHRQTRLSQKMASGSEARPWLPTGDGTCRASGFPPGTSRTTSRCETGNEGNRPVTEVTLRTASTARYRLPFTPQALDCAVTEGDPLLPFLILHLLPSSPPTRYPCLLARFKHTKAPNISSQSFCRKPTSWSKSQTEVRYFGGLALTQCNQLPIVPASYDASTVSTVKYLGEKKYRKIAYF